MRKNLHVRKAIIRRQFPMQIERATLALDEATGLYTPTILPLVDSLGCFQQLNKTGAAYADDLDRLTEGERTEAESVLWTLTEVFAGDQDGTSYSDKIIESRTGRKFKVLLVREKVYGSFYRAILAKVRNAA